MNVDMQKVKTIVLIKYSFMSSRVSHIPIIPNERIKTARTNGKVIYYNPNFVEKLSFNQRVTLLAHEYGHIVYEHIKRGKGKVNKVWNKATDAFINANLQKDRFEVIDGMIYIDGALNYTSEELYEKLLNEKEEEKNKNSESEYDPDEAHEIWNEEFDDDLDNEESNQTDNSRDYDYEERNLFEENRKNIKEKLQELRKLYTSSKVREIDNIEYGKQILNWEKELKQCTKSDYDWTYRNAKIYEGIIRPYLEEQPHIKTQIVLDTSGSINDTLLKNFLKSCKNILRFSEIEVGCFDTRFYGFNKIKKESDIDNIKLEGSGGTDFNAAVLAFSQSADNKIIFTDGYADMPDISSNIIWIVFGDQKINPKGGKVIYISSSDLNKLSFNESVRKI